MRNVNRFAACFLALASICLLAPVPAIGQPANRPAAQGNASALPLADRLPADALVYLGWVGADRALELAEGTHAQALLRQSDFQDLFNRYLPELLAKLGEQDAEARQVLAVGGEIAPILWRRPTAVAFGGINAAGGQPLPRLVILTDAGDQAEQLEARVRGLFEEAAQPEPAGFVARQGSILRIAVGYDVDELDRLAGGQGTLGASDDFRKAFTSLAERPVSGLYVDFPGLLRLAETAAGEFGGDEDQQQLRHLIDGLGLRGLGRLGLTTGFTGKLYETRGFIALTGREGLLKLIPDQPLDEQTLAAIPGGSTVVTADQLDLAAVLDVIRTIVTQAEPGAGEQMEQALEQANQATGIDIERDLLDQLGTTWVGFISPRIGSGALSAVVINRPRDAAKLDDSLTRLSQSLLEMVNQQVRRETEGEIALGGRRLERDGQVLHVLSLPALAPTWSVDRQAGALRIGGYPQSILSARALVGGESFIASRPWQDMRQRLDAGEHIVSLRYYDLPSLAPDSYPLLLLGTQMGVGVGDLFGEKLGTRPPMILLPPLATMMEHVEPAGAASWRTEEGVHFRMIEPFPMSTALAADWQSVLLQQYSTMVSVMIPSLNRAREAANRVKSGSNLRMIGQAMRQAAIDDVREGRYPPDLAVLFTGSDLPVEVFVSPRTETGLPDMMAQAREAQAQWVAENSDYVYVGSGITDSAPASVMVAYEDPDKVGDFDGVNVLFADGSVRFVTLDQLEQEVQRHIDYRRQRNLEVPPVLRR